MSEMESEGSLGFHGQDDIRVPSHDEIQILDVYNHLCVSRPTIKPTGRWLANAKRGVTGHLHEERRIIFIPLDI
jgi:hypothetical protein